MGYWIDYIKHTIQCIEGTTEDELLDRLHKTYNTMHRGYKTGGLLNTLHKTYNTMNRGYTRGGLLDRLHKTYNAMNTGYNRWVIG